MAFLLFIAFTFLKSTVAKMFSTLYKVRAEMIGIGKAGFMATYHNKTVKNIGFNLAIAF